MRFLNLFISIYKFQPGSCMCGHVEKGLRSLRGGDD